MNPASAPNEPQNSQANNSNNLEEIPTAKWEPSDQVETNSVK